MTEATLTAPSAGIGPDTALGAPAGAETVLTHRRGRWIDGWDPENLAQWEGPGRVIAKRNLVWSIFAEFLGFVVWQLWSIVAVMLPDRRLHPRQQPDLLAHLHPQPRRRDPAHSVLVPRAHLRRPQLDDHLGGAAADPRDRDGGLRRQPRNALPGAPARRRPRRVRRRQLRQLDVQHHLLLPAAREGLGSRPQRRRRQPRCLGRAVRRSDRRDDRRRAPRSICRSPAGSGFR